MAACSQFSFADDFVFCSVLLRDKKLCMELIELILDVKVKDITYINSQQTIEAAYDSKGIRLDVYVEGSDAVYDLEMQTVLSKNLAKRSRFYQSMIDQSLLEKGEDYEKLRKSYVVFICLSDPFDRNLSRYRLRKLCMEDSSIDFDDGSETVLLNASGKREGLSGSLTAFLDYLKTREVQDGFTGRINDKVTETTSNPEWRKERMTLDMKLKEYRDMGRAEGLQEGHSLGLQEGHSLGFEEGSENTYKILAVKMYNNGLGLPISEIARLQEKDEEKIKEYLGIF